MYTFRVAGLLSKGTSIPAILASSGVPKPAAITNVSACTTPDVVASSALGHVLDLAHMRILGMAKELTCTAFSHRPFYRLAVERLQQQRTCNPRRACLGTLHPHIQDTL